MCSFFFPLLAVCDLHPSRPGRAEESIVSVKQEREQVKWCCLQCHPGRVEGGGVCDLHPSRPGRAEESIVSVKQEREEVKWCCLL